VVGSSYRHNYKSLVYPKNRIKFYLKVPELYFTFLNSKIAKIRINQMPVSADRWQHRLSVIFDNFYAVKNHKNVTNYTTTEAREKIETDM
jgi:hypothetical protein